MNIDSMIQGNPQALVTSYNGVLVADSLEVADRFGKAHKNVVRDIENLMDGIEANRLKIEPPVPNCNTILLHIPLCLLADNLRRHIFYRSLLYLLVRL